MPSLAPRQRTRGWTPRRRPSWPLRQWRPPSRGTRSASSSVAGGLTVAPLGKTLAYLTTPSWGAPIGLRGGLTVLSWRVSRYVNRVGSWEAVIPVDEHPSASTAFQNQIKRGWHVSLVQEGVSPPAALAGSGEDWLLYQGIVQTRDYQVGEASASLKLVGSLRSGHLTDRLTGTGLAYTPSAIATAIADLLDGNDIIGPNGGALYPAVLTGQNIKITFNDLSRFATLLKLGEASRTTLRDSWDHDRPEFVHVDNPPFSGYVLTNLEAADGALENAAAGGIAVIGGTPLVRYDGNQVVNRIIPIGADTPDGDLTLGSSDKSYPYVIKSGTNPDSSTYYYIEDTPSQAIHGIVETRLNRTDVKNPSDTPGTRLAAANVLYAVAVSELLRKKSEVIEVTIPVANGADVWALPGESIRLRYTGVVETDEGDVGWLEEDRLFLITERHDQSDESGVRQVAFTLAAPEQQIEVPELPNAVTLPAPGASNGFGGTPATGPGSGPASPIPSCCPDPTTDFIDVDEPSAGSSSGDPGPAESVILLGLWTDGLEAKVYARTQGGWEERATVGEILAHTGAIRGDRVFVDEDNNNDGYAYLSLNGGVSFTTLQAPEGLDFNRIALDSQGRLWAYMDVASGFPPGPVEGVYYSDDNGGSWVLSLALTDEVKDFRINLQDDNRLAVTTIAGSSPNVSLTLHFTKSRGALWTQTTLESGLSPAVGFPFSKIVWMPSGRLVILSGDADLRCYYSDDDGVDWTTVGVVHDAGAVQHRPQSVASGNCIFTVLQFINPPLSYILRSQDGGQTFSTLSRPAGSWTGDGRHSYPQIKDGKLWVSFEVATNDLQVYSLADPLTVAAGAEAWTQETGIPGGGDIFNLADVTA